MPSGGGGGGTQTVKNEPPAYVKPYAEELMKRGAALSNAPYQAYGGQRVAGFSPEQQQGLQMMTQRAINGSPVQQSANQMLGDTLDGSYLNSNPYLDQMANNVTDRMQSAFSKGTAAQTDAMASRARALGGSAHAEMVQDNARAFGDSVGNTLSNLYGQNYANERNNQMQAMGMVPQMAQMDYNDINALLGVGDARREYSQEVLNQNYQNWFDQQQQPYKNLDTLSQAIAGALGGGGSTQTTSSTGVKSNKLSGVAGGAMTGYSMGGPVGAALGGLAGLFG